MSRMKAETLSAHASVSIKQLLRLAAERGRRSVASTIEIQVRDCALQHGIQAEAPRPMLAKGCSS